MPPPLHVVLNPRKKADEPWFVAADVCKAIQHSNARVAVQSLEESERRKFNLDPVQAPVNIVSESGMYTMVLRSRKPEAQDFRRWVTKEVLPAIRRNGGYMTPEVAQAAGMGLDLTTPTALKGYPWARRNNSTSARTAVA